jgi:hypothetical protein
MKDIRVYFEETARKVQLETVCAEHNKRASFTTTKNGDNVNVKWDCCCDTQKNLIESKFKLRIGDAMQIYISDTLKDSFRGIPGITIR